MHYSKILLFILVILVILMITALSYINRPLSPDQATRLIQKRLDKLVTGSAELSSSVLHIDSTTIPYKHIFISGTMPDGTPIDSSTQYHTASIGKTFTATLVHILAEDGLFTLDAPISNYLRGTILEDLYYFEGNDYRYDVTISHLLSHTSGIGDYFEDPVTAGLTMQSLLLADPSHIWKPLELLDFTRTLQAPVGKPGEIFHYSDSGYILLGLLLEEVSGQSFDVLLQEDIFKPLGMKHSYLLLPSDPFMSTIRPILPLTLNGIDLTQSNALSVDWSGGGIVTTTSDLLTFFKALHNNALITSEGLKAMTSFDHIYDQGIYYGQGIMLFRLKELSFLLRGMPDIYGGVGASGTYMLYDEDTDTYMIMNLGSVGTIEKGIQALVQIMMIYGRIK